MDYFLQIFGGINFGTVIIFSVALFGFFTLCTKTYMAIVEFHDKIQHKNKSLVEVGEKTKKLESDLEEIVKTQNSIIESISKISKAQEFLSSQIKDFEEVVKKQNLNKIRDRLIQSYRYYTNEERNPLKAWTEMEKDAFDRLFENYEELGGDGYIHSVVEPEMNSLEVIDMADTEGMNKLMKNRKMDQ